MIPRGPAGATLNQAFGNSVQMLEAVRFIFDQAGNRPCVCNLSLGTNGGPHDGTSLVEQGLDALVREKDNRAVVIAASNSQTDNIHTSGKVPKDAPLDIVFRQQSGGGGEFELWYSGQRSLQVSLIAQDGTTFGPVQPGDNLPIGANGQIAIFISSRVNDPNNHDNVIGIWVAEGLSGDDFTVRLTSLDGKDADFHAWIERNDRTQASFLNPVPTHTLGSISTGRETIVARLIRRSQKQFAVVKFLELWTHPRRTPKARSFSAGPCRGRGEIWDGRWSRSQVRDKHGGTCGDRADRADLWRSAAEGPITIHNGAAPEAPDARSNQSPGRSSGYMGPPLRPRPG